MNFVDVVANKSAGSIGAGEVSAGGDAHFGIVNFRVAGDLFSQLSRVADSENWEASVVLFSAFQELLRRYTNQESVVVRFQQDGTTERNMALRGNLTFRQTVQQNHEQGSRGNEAPEKAAVDGQFSFRGQHEPLNGAPVEPLDSAIHWSFYCTEGGVKGVVQYDRKSWDPALMESFSISYENLLRSALASLDSPIDRCETLSEEDVRTFDAWNRTFRDYPKLRVNELFEFQAAETPGSLAVTFEGASMTYRELSAAASDVAARLKAVEVGPGDVVGVCMERCNEMVVALLAIFRAGAAYLPLDPAYPADRIAFMQEDAKPVAILTQPLLRSKFSFGDSRVLLMEKFERRTDSIPRPDFLPFSESSFDNLAYVLYTSGSTGKPKGVQITHRALTNLLVGVASDLPLEKSDVFLATSSISFDISAFELFAPLISGAHLVIAPRSVAVSGELLAQAIQTSGATMLQATPSGWRVLLEAGWEGQPGLKMLTAGEPLDKTLARRLLDRGAGLWNLYGPTEATIYATGKKITREDAKITVGIPLPNYTTYVLDRNRRRKPVGAVGELYLGGAGIAFGYLNRPELTGEKFVPDPFTLEAEGHLYRTGDLARFLPDGEIELLGRADNQVKLRGHRIELEEIEALFDGHPAIRKSVAKVVDFGEDDQRLVAYVVRREMEPLDEMQLREHALRVLPSYMVPSLFIPLEAFTLTPNGKIDRKALPNPARMADAAAECPGQEEDLESIVLSCWRSVLKIPDLRPDQNFFDAGGHSFLVARMFIEMEARLERKLPISLLLEAPTARTFAELLGKTKDYEVKCAVTIQPEGSLPPLYFLHHLLGDILIYRTLATCFAPDRPVLGIQPPTDLLEREGPRSLQALAGEYVQELLTLQQAGPYHLAGFSSGAVMAFEMARQLTELGHEVGMLAMIDGDVQGERPAMPKVQRYAKIVVRKFAKIIFKMRDEINEGPKQFVGKRLRYLQLLWRMKNLENSSMTDDLTMVQALLLAERAYTPEPYSGSGLLIRFHDEAWKYGPDPMMGWRDLIEGGVETIDFPGGHITGMSPAGAPRLAETLKTQMANIEAAKQRKLRSEKARAAAAAQRSMAAGA